MTAATGTTRRADIAIPIATMSPTIEKTAAPPAERRSRHGSRRPERETSRGKAMLAETILRRYEAGMPAASAFRVTFITRKDDPRHGCSGSSDQLSGTASLA